MVGNQSIPPSVQLRAIHCYITHPFTDSLERRTKDCRSSSSSQPFITGEMELNTGKLLLDPMAQEERIRQIEQRLTSISYLDSVRMSLSLEAIKQVSTRRAEIIELV